MPSSSINFTLLLHTCTTNTLPLLKGGHSRRDCAFCDEDFQTYSLQKWAMLPEILVLDISAGFFIAKRSHVHAVSWVITDCDLGYSYMHSSDDP